MSSHHNTMIPHLTGWFLKTLRGFRHAGCFILACLIVLFTSAVASAQTTTILRVDIVNGSPGGDGSAWGSDAYRFLEDAFAEAADNADDENPYHIWVAQGTYRPDQTKENDGCDDTATPVPWVCCPPFGDCTQSARFTIPGFVSVLGGFPDDADNSAYGPNGATEQDRDPALYPTILSGDLGANIPCDGSLCFEDSIQIFCEGDLNLFFNYRADNIAEVVRMTGDEPVLDGFTVSGGVVGIVVHSSNKARIRDCIVQHNGSGGGDGGFGSCTFPPIGSPAIQVVLSEDAQIWHSLIQHNNAGAILVTPTDDELVGELAVLRSTIKENMRCGRSRSGWERGRFGSPASACGVGTVRQLQRLPRGLER